MFNDMIKITESAKYLLEKYGMKITSTVDFVQEKCIGDDYRIEVCNDKIKLFGNTSIAFNSAVGKILRSDINELDGYRCHFEKEIRGAYFANHFYNYYHSAPIDEVCEYMETLALWGMSVVQLWFDMHHFTSLSDSAAKSMMHRMKEIFKKARSLGMKTSLTKLANEYYDTGKPKYLAQNSLDNGLYKSKLCGYYYTELCPSNITGKELLINSVKEMFSELSDIGLDYICLWPYDQGGCTCNACYPWGGNGFYKLSKEIAVIAKGYFPDINIIVSAWYFDLFTDGEWDLFIDSAKNDGKKAYNRMYK